MNHPSPTATTGWRRWKIVGLGAALVGALSLAACHHGGIGGHHHRHGAHGQMSPEQAAKRVDKMVNWVLDDVDATDEQKSKVSALAKGALQDLQPLRIQHHAARNKAIELLTQDQIDRQAMEQLRAQEIDLAEQASKRLTAALADIAEVMTPEQRRKLAEQYKKRWS